MWVLTKPGIGVAWPQSRLDYDQRSGRSRSGGMSGRLLLPFLQSKGLRQIDKVFITHPHKDHYGHFMPSME